MEFDIAGQSEAVVDAGKQGKGNYHMWLHGFYELTKNSDLDCEKINTYYDGELSRHPPFSKLPFPSRTIQILDGCLLQESFSYDQTLNLADVPKRPGIIAHPYERIIADLSQELEQKHGLGMFYVHLPVTDLLHLEFPMFKKGNRSKFVSTTCEECEGFTDHGLNEVMLRESNNYTDLAEFGEPRFDIVHLDKVGIYAIVNSYMAMRDFIENTRVSSSN